MQLRAEWRFRFEGWVALVEPDSGILRSGAEIPSLLVQEPRLKCTEAFDSRRHWQLGYGGE